MLLDYKEAAAQLHDDISALGQQKKKKNTPYIIASYILLSSSSNLSSNCGFQVTFTNLQIKWVTIRY